MSPTKEPKEPKPVDPNALKRESAGRYSTPDGRFEVEQNSGRWMISDTAETNDFGLPLIRGPFATLDEVREAIGEAREGATPTSPLAGRVRGGGTAASAIDGKAEPTKAPSRARDDRRPEPEPESEPERTPERPPIVIQRLEPGDDGIVRKLAALSELAIDACGGFRRRSEREVGPIDRARARHLLARDDVHLIVASEEDEPVGHVLAFELPRLRDELPIFVIEEIAVAEDRRRQGIGTQLAEALVDLAREKGAETMIAFAGPEDRRAQAFYRSTGGDVIATDAGLVEFAIDNESGRRRR